MASGCNSTELLVQQAFGALIDAGDAKAVQRLLASTARALASALPPRDSLYDPDLDGLPLSPATVKAAAIDTRFFLELLADLFGNPGDPDWMGDDFAFTGTLKKRPGWRPPRTPIQAEERRMLAAKRVYELMAAQCFDTGRAPKQEAAIAAVMVEFGLARSKVMKGLKEYRQMAAVWCSPLSSPAGEWTERSPQEALAWAHFVRAESAMILESHRRNGPHEEED